MTKSNSFNNEPRRNNKTISDFTPIRPSINEISHDFFKDKVGKKEFKPSDLETNENDA